MIAIVIQLIAHTLSHILKAIANVKNADPSMAIEVQNFLVNETDKCPAEMTRSAK